MSECLCGEGGREGRREGRWLAVWRVGGEVRVIGEGCLGGMRTLSLDMWGTLADKGRGCEWVGLWYT